MSAIADYHLFEGAALSVITSEGKFTALNRLDLLNGSPIAGRAWAVNHDTVIYIKHATKGTSRWVFNFSGEHQRTVRDLFNKYQDKTLVVLVCAKVGFCVLPYGEYAAIIDEVFTDQRALTVKRPAGGGFRVEGPLGKRPGVVPLNRFPGIVFQ